MVLWALLCPLLMGGSCEEPEAVPLEELRRDAAPAFDYGLYSDEKGKLVGSRSAVLLVHRTGHLERVYEDAQAGDARAKVLFGQLEDTFQRTGNQLAQRASGLVCNSMPACVVQWHQLEEYTPSHGPGGLRLRQRMADSFAREAKVQHVRNVVLAAALDVLLVGAVLTPGSVAAVEVEAGAAEASVGPVEAGRLALAGVEGTLATEELPALEARMAEAEALEPGPRHPARLEPLARHRPVAAEPPSGVEADTAQWKSYVAYWERRYEELAGTRPLPPGHAAVKPPLTWQSYSSLLGQFQRSLEFQRSVIRVLQQAPGGDRAWVPGMKQPLASENVGLRHDGSTALTYADGFVVDKSTLGPGGRPNVHSFSVKQRDFSSMSVDDAVRQVRADALEAKTKYGGTVEVRRPGHPLFGKKVVVTRVHLVYDGEKILLEFKNDLSAAATAQQVELHYHVP